MLSLSGNTVLVVRYVVLMPFTHFIFPIVFFIKAVVSHTVIIPVLLMIRIAIFGLVYLPLTPFLSLAHVNYDKNVPVEVSLFRLVKDASPHLWFFMINLLHYVMVSVFVGTCVGLVTGFNISLIVRIVALPNRKSTASKTTQTTPYVNAIEHKLARYPQVGPKSGTRGTTVKKEPIGDRPVKAEYRRDVGIALSPLPLPVLSNAPVIKKEEGHNLKPVFRPSNMEMYEDDDGYSYMTYGSQDPLHGPHFPRVDSFSVVDAEETKETKETQETKETKLLYEDDDGYSYMTHDPLNPLPLVVPKEDRVDIIDEESDSETNITADSVAPDTVESSTIASEFTSVAEPAALEATSEGEHEEHETDVKQKQS